MGFLTEKAPSESSDCLPFVNTGTMQDMFTGQYVTGFDGKRYLSGGLSSANAVQAGPNKFKSSLLHTTNVNACVRYPGSDYYVADSEDALRDRARLCRMIQYDYDSPEARVKALLEFEEHNLRVFNTTHEYGQSAEHFLDYVQELGELKLKHRKECEVLSPYVDKRTGKQQRILIPTFAGVDSFTELDPIGMLNKKEKRSAETEDKVTRTDGAEIARMKKAVIQRMNRMSLKYGVYFSLSAHLNPKMSLDGKPQPKDLPHMKQGQAATGVSRQFYYYMTYIAQIDATKAIPDIPMGKQSSDTELMNMDISLVRSKNGNSGNTINYTSSQQYGVLTSLGWYNYLRANEYFGLGTSGKPRCTFIPDVQLFKSRAFELCQDYKMSRALEILGQLCFIQKNWTLIDPPCDYLMEPERLYDLLMKSSIGMDDVLNSRGWWTYGDHPREYLGLPDILDIATGAYVPKLIAVTEGKRPNK